jgi:hypothetical protein
MKTCNQSHIILRYQHWLLHDSTCRSVFIGDWICEWDFVIVIFSSCEILSLLFSVPAGNSICLIIHYHALYCIWEISYLNVGLWTNYLDILWFYLVRPCKFWDSAWNYTMTAELCHRSCSWPPTSHIGGPASCAGLFYVEFVVDRVTLGQNFLWGLQFSPVAPHFSSVIWRMDSGPISIHRDILSSHNCLL